MQGCLFDGKPLVNELHFGGGTPTFFSISQLKSLLKVLRDNFCIADSLDLEQSIKVDPRTTTPATIRALATMGFNQISLGVQDFDPAVQAAVNRVQAVSDTLDIIKVSKQSGFSSVTVYLVYGLPLQTELIFSETLDHIITARPDRVVTSCYLHDPVRFSAHSKIHLADLPNAKVRSDLQQMSQSAFVSAGYIQIGSDEFVLPNDQLAKAASAHHRHYNSQGYSIHSDRDFIGIGMSAISRIGDIHCQNAKSIQSYQRMLDAGHFPVTQGMILRTEDKLRGEIIEAIMCDGEIPVDKIEKKYGISFNDHFASALHKLRPMVDKGLIDLSQKRLRIRSEGRPLLQDIAVAFDEHLTPSETAHCSAQEKIIPKLKRADLATRPPLSTAYALEMQ